MDLRALPCGHGRGDRGADQEQTGAFDGCDVLARRSGFVASRNQTPSGLVEGIHMSGMTEDAAIRPFTIEISEAELEALRARIAATRWPERETVADDSQGVQLATMQELVRYWGTEYDFGRFEARLNALPQFSTEIDGLDIHFIHVKSPHENALPLIITHGWPGSVIEMLNVVGPLTDPTAHGGDAEDAFDVVVPSMPGYGFSGKPTVTGWDPVHIAGPGSC
jgi:epoxide hydrolase-like protein